MKTVFDEVVLPNNQSTTDKHPAVSYNFSHELGITNLADADKLMTESIVTGKKSLWTIIKVMATVESQKYFEQDGFKDVNDWAGQRFNYSPATLANYHSIIIRPDLMELEAAGWSVSSVERIKALPAGTDISDLSPDMSQKELNDKVKEIKATLSKAGEYKPRKKKSFKDLSLDRQEIIIKSKIEKSVEIITKDFNLTSRSDIEVIKQIYNEIGKCIQSNIDTAMAVDKAQRAAERERQYRESADVTMDDAENLSLQDKQELINRLNQLIAEEKAEQEQNDVVVTDEPENMEQ